MLVFNLLRHLSKTIVISVKIDHDVNSVVNKVLEKIKGLAVEIPESAQDPSSVHFVGNKPSSRFTIRGKNPYPTRSRNFRRGITHQLPRPEDAGLAKVLITICKNALQDSVRPVEIKATILGTNRAPSIHD